MKEIVELRITHFRFAIGGEHYYGEFWVRSKAERVVDADGTERYVHRVGYGVEPHPRDKTKLERKIGAREAAYLNKKDTYGGIGGHLRAGDMTTRFNDREALIATAKKVFPTLFDADDILVLQDEDNDTEMVLVGPSAIVDLYANNPSRRARHEFLEANGYLVK